MITPAFPAFFPCLLEKPQNHTLCTFCDDRCTTPGCLLAVIALCSIDFQHVDFVEYFNLTADNWQMNNLWNASSTAAAQAKLHTKLHAWYNCHGTACP